MGAALSEALEKPVFFVSSLDVCLRQQMPNMQLLGNRTVCVFWVRNLQHVWHRRKEERRIWGKGDSNTGPGTESIEWREKQTDRVQ